MAPQPTPLTGGFPTSEIKGLIAGLKGHQWLIAALIMTGRPLEVQLWSRDGIYLGDLGEREDWIWCGASIN